MFQPNNTNYVYSPYSFQNNHKSTKWSEIIPTQNHKSKNKKYTSNTPTLQKCLIRSIADEAMNIEVNEEELCSSCKHNKVTRKINSQVEEINSNNLRIITHHQYIKALQVSNQSFSIHISRQTCQYDPQISSIKYTLYKRTNRKVKRKRNNQC